MMEITLNNCGKSYNRKWLFQNLNLTFKQNEKWAILGANGSGKSTIGLMLCGQVWPTEGSINTIINGKKIPQDQMFAYSSLASPAMELPGEFSLTEICNLQAKAKPFVVENTLDRIKEICGFDNKTANKPLYTFSSGMLQRVKLMLAAFANTPVLILDEPLSNLDDAGHQVYQTILDQYCNNRLLIVASNRLEEHAICPNQLTILGNGLFSVNQ